MPRISRTMARMGYKSRARTSLASWPRVCLPIVSCSSRPPRSAPSSSWPTTGCSGTSIRARVSPTMKERLRVLFDNDIALAGYHLPLDAHPEVGNNALICAALGLEQGEPFGDHRGRAVGFVGRSSEGVAFDELRRRCEAAFGQEPFVWDSRPGRGPHRRDRLGRRGVELRRGDRARARRVPHRRARRARDGGRAREPHALHRGRPLRDRDVRRAAPRRARSRSDSASSTTSSMLPNPI